MHFAFQHCEQRLDVALIKKRDRAIDRSIKGKCGNLPRATVAFAVLPPLDRSFRCEGGSCSLHLAGDEGLWSRTLNTLSDQGSSYRGQRERPSHQLKLESCRNADGVSTARQSSGFIRPSHHPDFVHAIENTRLTYSLLIGKRECTFVDVYGDSTQGKNVAKQ
jgi:hypothetical protein